MLQEIIIFGVPLGSVLTVFALSTFGFGIHVASKVAELRIEDKTLTLLTYFQLYPYATFTKLAAVVGLALGLAEPEITKLGAMGAIGLGYSADSAVNKLKGPK